jgi:hypothetical protein
MRLAELSRRRLCIVNFRRQSIRDGGGRYEDLCFFADLHDGNSCRSCCRCGFRPGPSGTRSKEVADYYIARRGIPASNQCSVKPGSADGPGNETIDVAAFDRLIKKPIQRCLTAVGKDKILYIVLAYGTPYKVSARPGLGMAVD